MILKKKKSQMDRCRPLRVRDECSFEESFGSEFETDLQGLRASILRAFFPGKYASFICMKHRINDLRQGEKGAVKELFS